VRQLLNQQRDQQRVQRSIQRLEEEEHKLEVPIENHSDRDKQYGCDENCGFKARLNERARL
jgi:hypothetical protein